MDGRRSRGWVLGGVWAGGPRLTNKQPKLSLVRPRLREHIRPNHWTLQALLLFLSFYTYHKLGDHTIHKNILFYQVLFLKRYLSYFVLYSHCYEINGTNFHEQLSTTESSFFFKMRLFSQDNLFRVCFRHKYPF